VNFLNKIDKDETDGLNKKLVSQIEQPSHIKQKAKEILETGNPIEFIMEQFSKIHIGDRELGELLLLSTGSQFCINTEGLHVNCSGQSGKGKTDACKALGFLLPEEYFISGSLSNKALLYMNIKSGSVVLIDDVDEFNIEMEQLIKSTISSYQTGYKHRFTDFKKQGANKSQEVWIPPRTAFWFTSVHSSFDMQVLNRLIKIDVDESPEQNRLILERVLDNAVAGKCGFDLTEDVEVCREIFRQLKQKAPCEVSIPFAKQLIEKSTTPRNLKMFLDMIMSSAAFFQFSRIPPENGQIIASRSDLDRAERLWKKIHRAQCTGLTGEEQKVLDAIFNAGNMGISNKDLEIRCNLNKGSVSRAIHGKKQSHSDEHKGGLKNKIVGLSYHTNRKVWIYEGSIENQDSIVSLMDQCDEKSEIDSSCIQLHTVATPMQPIFSTENLKSCTVA